MKLFNIGKSIVQHRLHQPKLPTPLTKEQRAAKIERDVREIVSWKMPGGGHFITREDLEELRETNQSYDFLSFH